MGLGVLFRDRGDRLYRLRGFAVGMVAKTNKDVDGWVWNGHVLGIAPFMFSDSKFG